jgi:N-acetylmuramoyl-L-alanine amidase
MTLKKSTRQITYLVVHCSATPEGKAFTVKDIDQWHRARGFKGIGYNYVIYLDGTIHEGRDVNLIPAHVEGHNKDSIGICYIGGCEAHSQLPKDTRTPQQKAALLELLKALKKLYPNAQILGHRDFAGVNKACPCFNAKDEYKSISK